MAYGAFVNVLTADRDNWRQQFEFVRSLPGIGALELWIEQDLTTSDVLWIRSEVASLGVRLSIHAPFVGLALASHVGTLREAAVDRVVEMATVGEALGAEVITCHAGLVGSWIGKDAAFRTLAASFRRIMESTALDVAVENMPGRAGGTIEPVVTLEDVQSLTALVPGLGVTVDVGHCLQNREDPAHVIQSLGSALRHVHLHDGFAGGRAHLKLGAGDLDLESVVRGLNGFEGTVSLETVGDRDTRESWSVLSRLIRSHQPA